MYQQTMIDEALMSKQFDVFIIEAIARIHTDRANKINKANEASERANPSRPLTVDPSRPSTPGSRMRFKKDAFSTLEDMNMLTPDLLATEYIMISYKASKLSSNLRRFIKEMVADAIMRTLVYNLKQPAAEPTLPFETKES
jgi:hypothetical protein